MDLTEPNLFLELLGDFVLDARERLERVEQILLDLGQSSAEGRQARLVAAKRELHTVKGNSAMVGLEEVRSLAHTMEDGVEAIDLEDPRCHELLGQIDLLRQLIEASADEPGAGSPETDVESAAVASREPAVMEAVRVSFTDLDALMDVLAEMVIFRNRLQDAVANRHLNDPGQAWDEVEAAEEALGTTLNVIQDRVMGLRMVPLSALFVSLKRIVHDAAASEGKEVRFEVSGGDTPMDKALLEVANETLGHLVRNAVIHGIEAPVERRRAGKPPCGRVRLAASTQGNEVLMDVIDDGAGINAKQVLERARALGLDSRLVDDPMSLLFEAGVSTRQETDVGAGRGIGLAAAMAAVQSMGGRIEISSREGEGTRFRARLPLSVSITRALLMRVDDELYALPIVTVEESVRLEPGEVHEVNQALVYTWRDAVVPVLDLGLTFGTSNEPRQRLFVVLIAAAGKTRGLLVDGFAGIREIVVKGLDPLVGSPAGVSGSTILGDGRVVLILDPTALATINTRIRKEEIVS